MTMQHTRIRRRRALTERQLDPGADQRYGWARDHAALQARTEGDDATALRIRQAQVENDVPELERLLGVAAARGWTTWPPPPEWLRPVIAHPEAG
jgi:hypothetical protein